MKNVIVAQRQDMHVDPNQMPAGETRNADARVFTVSTIIQRKSYELFQQELK